MEKPEPSKSFENVIKIYTAGMKILMGKVSLSKRKAIFNYEKQLAQQYDMCLWQESLKYSVLVLLQIRLSQLLLLYHCHE